MKSHTFTGFNSRSVRLTGLPFGPSSPGGPLAPAGPAAPGGPASPFSPLSPLGPYSDVGEVGVFLMSASKEDDFFFLSLFFFTVYIKLSEDVLPETADRYWI